MIRIRTTAALLTIAVLAFLQCGKHGKEEGILAVVGDRVITADEFIRRAEYTVRPPYCSGDSPQARTIILNSLVAEKLFALEGGDRNPLSRSPAFKSYILGRKEQFMRQILIEEVTKGKTAPDGSEFDARYSVAGREYRLGFFTVSRAQIGALKDWAGSAVRSESFNDLHERTGGLGPPPERNVSWKSRELPAVHKALFSGPLRKHQVIGPIDVGEDGYLMMRILDWSDRPAGSDQEVRERRESVRRELEEERKQTVWDATVFGLMQGKKLEFQREPFEKMADLMRIQYMPDRKPKDVFSLDGWTGDGLSGRRTTDSILTEIRSNRLAGRPFFTFDGRTWTVTDFLKLTASHPLVFRKRRMRPDEFPEQFKLAVADLLRDDVVNRKAYDCGIDRLPIVRRETEMWSDALLAGYHRYRIMRSKGAVTDSIGVTGPVLERVLTPYSDTLFQKYSGRITIHVPLLESIRLSRVDMVVLNRDTPFLETVPAFPVITSESRLKYGTTTE